LKEDLAESVTSAHTKAELRERLAARERELAKAAKKLTQAKADKATAAAVATAEEAAAAGRNYVVLELDGVDPKSLQPLVQKVVKTTSLAVLALSADPTAGKVACMAASPEGTVERLPANKWLQAVLKEVEGRGGGKPGSAQGSGTDVSKMDQAVATARALADSALE
jgi:alanyl-tRNA synthetase